MRSNGIYDLCEHFVICRFTRLNRSTRQGARGTSHASRATSAPGDLTATISVRERMKYSVLIAIIDSLDPEVLDMASDPVFKQSNKSSDHLNKETRACCVISRSKLKLVYDNVGYIKTI